MTDIQIDAGTLEFSEADGMTATGLLVPFGEECKSNLGKFTVEPDSFTVPSDLTGMSLNVEHEREKVVGAPTSVTVNRDAGIFGTFRFADTDEGRKAYEDARSGKRKHLSAEVSGVVIRAGKAVAGRLFAAAQVERPAFPSATLLAAAVDTEEPSSGPTVTEEDITEEFTDEAGVVHSRKVHIKTEIDGDKTTITRTEVIEEPQPNNEQEQEPTVLPNTLNAAASTAPTGLTLHEVGELLYAARHGQISQDALREKLAGQNGDTLFGALSDVKYNGTGGLSQTMTQPQWIGEVAALATFKQMILPLFRHADLTSLALSGFKWTTKPTGGDWAGNKTDVPSNTLVVAPVTGTAAPWAVGHDIAREFVDFPVPGFFESYAIAVLESYMKWADTKVATAVVAGATALAADLLATIPGNPAATTTNIGGTIGTTASAIIDGATVLVTNGILPEFALVAPALWKQMAKIPKNNVLGYLNAALGLDEGSLDGFVIRPSTAVAAGKVLVGAAGAATVYELPNAPIRIDALDLAKGGVDKAAFGYLGVVINDATALQLVTAATA